MKRKWIFGIIGLSFFSACSTPQDFYAAQKNTQGNNYAAEQYYVDAKKAYADAENVSDTLSPIAKNNQALVLARQQQFEEANTLLGDFTCDQEVWCAESLYNKGNILYRLGEGQKEQKQIDLWKKALTTYEQSLKKNPDDQWTQENIEFLKKKLQTAEKKQEEKEKKKEKKEEQKDQGKKGDHQKSGSSEDKKEKKKGGEEKNSNTNTSSDSKKDDKKSEKQKKEGASGSKEGKEEGKGEKGTKSEEKKNISKQLDDQIEKYMDDMEQTEKGAQKYFQRNPSSQQQGDPNDPFSQMYNDPFFQDLFQVNPSQNKGGAQRKQNEIDW